MSSTYSPSLRIELIGAGEQSGTWNTTTNGNLGTLIEQSIAGVTSISMVDANYTLTAYNGVSDQSRQAVIVVSGTNSAIRDVIAPLVTKTYLIKNNTSGGFAINVRATTGASVSIPNGVTSIVYCDGTNFNLGIAQTSTAAGTGVSISVVGATTTVNNTGVLSYNSRTGNVTPVSGDVTGALGYVPLGALSGAITTSGNVASLGSFSSAQLATALTDETGSGGNVFAISPTLVSPALGTPASGILTNCTGTAAGLTAGNALTATNPQSGGSFITSSNIGSQSVSFASSATNATNATNATTAASCSGNAATATTAASCSGNAATATTATNATNATNATTAANLNGTWTQMPAGTTTNFFQASAPTGWTQNNTYTNHMMRIVSGIGGGSGGTNSPILNNVVPSHTHGFTTGGVSANHTHYDSGHTHGYVQNYLSTGGTTAGGDPNSVGNVTVSTDVGYASIGYMSADHSHSGSTDNGSSQTNWTPQYIDNILCSKN